jgi:hypothetical protein
VILGLPVPDRNIIGRQAGIKPSALHISKRCETNYNQDCITKSSRALNPSRALYIHTRIMHEMGNHSWYTTVTLQLKGNTTMLLQEQRSKGLQTEVTDPTLHQKTEGGYAIRHSKDDNGLRGQKHNSDNPFCSPKILSGNPKLLVDFDLIWNSSLLWNLLCCKNINKAGVST